ncbi:MAG: hypothetical protein Q8P49_03340 [Candidatus Liptonbacteria bacterium]|nr:hypothetical protein [Candidatus Liptonbacteria bacterium]
MNDEQRTMNRRPFRPPLLHDHMDGCKTLLPILPELFRLANEPFPFSPSPERYAEEIKLLFRNAQIGIVEKFRNTTGVMQCSEALRLAAYAYTTERAKEGYTYCEMTIAPQYHTRGGLYETDVVRALIEGIVMGEKKFPEIEVDIIFTIGREAPPEEGVRLVEAAKFCDRDYVVGIGLVCDEAAYPPERHADAFRLAKRLGFKTTVHAGEWVNLPPDTPHPGRDRAKLLQNMRTAIVGMGADRIGHAIPLAYDEELIRLVTDREIGIEGCPGSNLTSCLIPDMAYLKIRDLLAAKVMYSMNPDDDLFLPDLDETFALCDSEYHFVENERRLLELNAWATRFGRRKEYPAPFEQKT